MLMNYFSSPSGETYFPQAGDILQMFPLPNYPATSENSSSVSIFSLNLMKTPLSITTLSVFLLFSQFHPLSKWVV